MERLGVVGVHHHGLGPGGLVDGITRNGGRFRHHQRPHHTVNGDFAILVGEVQAVAADLPVFIRYKLPCGGSHFEGDALQRFAGEGVPLVDDQRSGLGVFHNDGLGIAALPDDHIGGGCINDIPAVRGLDLRQYIRAGGQVGDLDLALGVRGKNAVLR